MTFVLARELGAVSGEAGTLRIAKGLVRLPDVAFVSAARVRALKQRESIPSLVPDLAVEVLSKTNTRREIERKIGEYFAAGAKLVWIIDPAKRSAVALTSPNQRTPIEPEGALDGRDVLPGFTFPLAELFRRADSMAGDER